MMRLQDLQNDLSFQVVSGLAACDGTVCTNLASGGATAQTPQKAFGRIKTIGDFYVPNTSQVILTTQFSTFDRGTCAKPSLSVETKDATRTRNP